MIKFLFWNLNQKLLGDRVVRLVHNHDIDVVMLAECPIRSSELLHVLEEGTGSAFTDSFTLLENMTVCARFPKRSLRTLAEDKPMRLSLRQLFLPSGTDILLVITHFPSKLYWNDASQSQLCTELAALVGRREDRLGHSRTILVGDLNMNPFEVGVVSSHGLNATMARKVAKRETRVIQGKKHHFFYNPMWGNFGDTLDGPPGTYYDSRAEPVCYFWNVFDQVLLRPALLGAFPIGSLKILDSDGTDSLLTKHGLPDGSAASDHLPIVFALDL